MRNDSVPYHHLVPGCYVQYDPFSRELPEAMRQRDH